MQYHENNNYVGLPSHTDVTYTNTSVHSYKPGTIAPFARVR
jgi:hypothetical protein